MTESPETALRRIPSMDALLGDAVLTPLIARFGREQVKAAARAYLDSLRSSNRVETFSVDALAASVESVLSASMRPTLRRVVNASGIIIHTNLGRSPLSPEAWNAAAEIVCGYSNLELDLAKGARGKRHLHISDLASRLFGCEAAILVNNNAAAVLLVLASIANRKEVVVSRGELVEIGGAFRVPDVIAQGGATLREVGTTNKTRAADFEEAIGRRTGAILSVHQSNFQIVGFTEAPDLAALSAIARKKKVPLVIDEGSGRVVDLERYGFRREPTVRELLALGADVVTCSTDKLIGSVQGGLILGRTEILETCARHPLMRALRPGKETFAMIGEALAVFLSGSHEERIPIYRMLSTPLETVRRRAENIAGRTGSTVVETRAALGGGTTPEETTPSFALHVSGDATKLHRALLDGPVPILARIAEDRLLLDMRTVLEEEDGLVSDTIAKLAT